MTDNDQNLLTLIGGPMAVTDVVDKLFDRVMSEERLAHFFEGIDMTRQRKHIVRFLVASMELESFDEDLLRRAHFKQVTDSGLGNEEFDLVKQMLNDTLTETGLDADLVSEVDDLIDSMRHAILQI